MAVTQVLKKRNIGLLVLLSSKELEEPFMAIYVNLDI